MAGMANWLQIDLAFESSSSFLCWSNCETQPLNSIITAYDEVPERPNMWCVFEIEDCSLFKDIKTLDSYVCIAFRVNGAIENWRKSGFRPNNGRGKLTESQLFKKNVQV